MAQLGAESDAHFFFICVLHSTANAKHSCNAHCDTGNTDIKLLLQLYPLAFIIWMELIVNRSDLSLSIFFIKQPLLVGNSTSSHHFPEGNTEHSPLTDIPYWAICCLQVFVEGLFSIRRASSVCHEFHSNLQKNLWGNYWLEWCAKYSFGCTRVHHDLQSIFGTQLVSATERGRNKQFGWFSIGEVVRVT